MRVIPLSKVLETARLKLDPRQEMSSHSISREALRALLPPEAFTDEEISSIDSICSVQSLTENAVLMEEGDAFDNRVYFILKGSVSVYMRGKFILRLNNRGDTVGEMGLISAAPRSATVKLDRDSEFLVLNSSMSDVIEGDASYKFRYFLSRIFNTILTRKLRTTSERARLYEDMAEHSQEVEEQRAGLESDIAKYLEQINMFNHLVNSATEAILVTDTAGKILNANPALKAEFNIESHNLLGVEIAILLGMPDGSPGNWGEISARANSGGWVGEVVIYHPEKGQIPAECTISAIQGAEQELLAYSIFMRNITVRKALEKKARKQQAELEGAYEAMKELDKAKRSFLDLVSHELRTPLTAILGCGELLLTEGLVEPEDQGEFLETIFREATKLNEMVAKVLAISKIEGGEMSFQFEEQSMGEVVKQRVELFRERAKVKGLEFQYESEDNLPPMMFDAANIGEALSQLIDNAVKFTSTGEIKVQLSKGNDGALISVEDTGMGMEGMDMDKVLNAFGKGDTENIAAYGLGLGLPLCYLIVKAHSGDLHFNATESGGTRASITLPQISNPAPLPVGEV